MFFTYFFYGVVGFIDLRSSLRMKEISFCLKYTLMIFIPDFSFDFVYT